MSDTLVNIRVGYYHFKLYSNWQPAIEKNSYWVHYYGYKGIKEKARFMEVYQWFSYINSH